MPSSSRKDATPTKEASSGEQDAAPEETATLRQIAILVSALLGVCCLGGVLLAGIAMPFAATAGTSVNAVTSIFEETPSNLGFTEPSEQSVLLAADGTQIARFYAENRVVVSSNQISQHMKNAAVAIEDRRFYKHHGIDVQGLAGAFVNNLAGGATAGGSSITQQYVKNAIIERGRASGNQELIAQATERTIGRKLNEARLAVAIEKKMSKEQILTGYLNLAQFGTAHYGVESAAKHYFSKSAKDLTIPEAAMLAGITQSPARWDPIKPPDAAKPRRDTVLGEMYRNGYISKDELNAAVAVPIQQMLKVSEDLNGCAEAGTAAYFCEYVVNDLLKDSSWGKTRDDRVNKLYRGGLTIQTTLDLNKQKAAYNTLVSNIPVNDRSGIQTSLSSVEPGTGHIVAMAQNTNYGNQSANDRSATKINLNSSQDMRGGVGFQSGSTFKVFTLIQWLKSGYSPGDVVDSNQGTLPRSSWKISCSPKSRDNYRFGNLEGVGGGPMTVLDSTKMSVNGSFVRMANRLDLCDIAQTAKDMGVRRGDSKEWSYAPSMILGANNVTPLSMAVATSTLAAGGQYCAPTSYTEVKDADGKTIITKKPDCRQVLDKSVAHQTTEVLKNVISQGATGEKAQLSGREAAGKTGTANDDTNAWFIGYTPQLATSIWQGHQKGHRSMMNSVINGRFYHEVYGGLFPATIFSQYMTTALSGQPAVAFTSATPGSDTSTGRASSDTASSDTASKTSTAEPTQQPSTAEPSPSQGGGDNSGSTGDDGSGSTGDSSGSTGDRDGDRSDTSDDSGDRDGNDQSRDPREHDSDGQG